MLTHRITLPNGECIEFFGDKNTMETLFPEYKAKQRAEQKRKKKRQSQNSARRRNRGK
ncbi:hypothetical protein HYE60_11855 [Aggregatibacter actinomycetemcomitans]|nr:hypothetical protein [Aggregatibacter actinomycetemcomitans]